MKHLLIIGLLILTGCADRAPVADDSAAHATGSVTSIAQAESAAADASRHIGAPVPEPSSSPTPRESGSKDASRTKQRVNSYFSPNGEARDAMIREIGKARREVLVALYYFTDPKMAEALVNAKKRGCDVRMVLDRTQSNRKDSQTKAVVDAGIAVTFDKSHRIMHHKFCVIDRDTLITGSQNWTESSQTANAENTLIIHENRHLAGRYRETFLALTGGSEMDKRQQ